jgi:hypothetical protein
MRSVLLLPIILVRIRPTTWQSHAHNLASPRFYFRYHQPARCPHGFLQSGLWTSQNEAKVCWVRVKGFERFLNTACMPADFR